MATSKKYSPSWNLQKETLLNSLLEEKAAYERDVIIPKIDTFCELSSEFNQDVFYALIENATEVRALLKEFDRTITL